MALAKWKWLWTVKTAGTVVQSPEHRGMALKYIFLKLFIWLSCGMCDVFPWLVIELRPPTLGARGLRPWTSRVVPLDIIFEESHGQIGGQGRLRNLGIFLLEDLIWKGMRRYQSELSLLRVHHGWEGAPWTPAASWDPKWMLWEGYSWSLRNNVQKSHQWNSGMGASRGIALAIFDGISITINIIISCLPNKWLVLCIILLNEEDNYTWSSWKSPLHMWVLNIY